MGPGKEPSGPSTPLGITTAATTGLVDFDPADWDLWWHYNRARYIDLGRGFERLHPMTQGDVARSRPGTRRAGVSDTLVARSLVPRLVEELASPCSPGHEQALMLALARMGNTDEVALEPLFEARLSGGNAWVREGAIVALGVLGTGDAAVILAHLVDDHEVARRALARRSVPTRARCLAALSLGLCAARSEVSGPAHLAVHHLEPQLAWRKADSDLRTACALGLAISARPLIEPRAGAAPDLERVAVTALSLFEERRIDQRLEAQLPVLLGALAPHVSRLRQLQIAGELTDLMEPRQRTHVSTRRAAVLALGRVGDADEDQVDRGVRRALTRALDDRDRGVRALAPIALGHVAARPGDGAGDPHAGVRDSMETLLDVIDDAKALEQPWLGLGVGVLGSGLTGSSHAIDPRAQEAVATLCDEVKVLERTGTAALAAGLVRATEAGPAIQARYEGMSAFGWRGRMLTALGLLGDRSTLDEMRVGTKEGHHDPEWIEGASIGRALLGDLTVVQDLLVTYDACHCATSRFATTRALGWVGDVRAVGPLLEVALDPERPDWDRTFAVETLGRIADRDPRIWNSRLSAEVVFSHTPSILTDPGSGSGLFEHL